MNLLSKHNTPTTPRVKLIMLLMDIERFTWRRYSNKCNCVYADESMKNRFKNSGLQLKSRSNRMRLQYKIHFKWRNETKSIMKNESSFKWQGETMAIDIKILNFLSWTKCQKVKRWRMEWTSENPIQSHWIIKSTCLIIIKQFDLIIIAINSSSAY